MIEPPSRNPVELSTLNITRRRMLLPWWIKTFIWIFLVFAVIAPFGFILGLFHFTFQIALLGLSTNEPLSWVGLTLISIFIFKGISAFGLWAEKDWAITVAKVDTIISIVVCVITTAYYLFSKDHVTIRLELIVLFIYFYKLNKIEHNWVNFGAEDHVAPVTQV
ncbi:MAG: hypothetical protein ACXVB0_11260 [Mucilaginibacter sp.]